MRIPERERAPDAHASRYPLKLLILFPTKFAAQRVAKDAPFDVCESAL